MARITFVQPAGERATVDAAPGLTVMEAARDHGVAGIEAQCGGQCSCATCHCYVDSAWYARLPPVREPEKGLLEFAWEPRETSRLSCQLTVDDTLDGLVLHVPARQL
jgi:2Fe-2S ferredoxin